MKVDLEFSDISLRHGFGAFCGSGPASCPVGKKANFVLEQAMKAQRGSTEIAFLFFLNLGVRCGSVVNATPRPLYPRERDSVPV
jgi:hypothetical protein